MIHNEADARAILEAADLPMKASRTGNRLHVAGCCDHATYPLRDATAQEISDLNACWDCAWGLLRIQARLTAVITRIVQAAA